MALSAEDSDYAELCDFGLSCILSDVSTHAYSSSIAASTRYASPELLSASETRRTRESDIWAFGCTSAEVSCCSSSLKLFYSRIFADSH